MDSTRRTRPRLQRPNEPQRPAAPAPTYPAHPGQPAPGGSPAPLPQYPPPGTPGYPDPNRPYPPAQPPGGRPPGSPPPTAYYRVPQQPPPARRQPRRRRPVLTFRPGCALPILILALLFLLVALYFFAPGRINLMVLGIDYVDPANPVAVGRSDTLMMVTVDPPRGYVGLISIPRDLWVKIPNVGENRINTAHFFAESASPGSGPSAVRETIKLNFGIDIPYYLRFRFESFREIVDAMGGVDITLDEPTAGYPAGRHHLTGHKALAFVRNRTNSDDFFRMAQGQLMIKAMIKTMLNPLKWFRIPAIARAFFRSLDTNLPAWQWPRAAFALLRAGLGGIDNHVIDREMTTGFTTNEGAMVLAPNWPAIHELVNQVFR